MALDETAAATATPTTTLYLDLAKFYDNVHLPTLLRTARSLEYPSRALALCGQMFFAPRVIRVNGFFAAAIQPQTGTVPGSGQANHLARALWCDLLEKDVQCQPFDDGASYVDDVMLRIEASTRELGRIMQTADVKLVQRAQHLNLPVSDRKSVDAQFRQTGGCGATRTAAMRTPSATCEGQPATLESNATLGRKRRLTCAAQRRQQAYSRLYKLSRFQGLEHKRMLQSTNILPKAACDTTVTGLPVHLAQKLRARTIDSSGVLRGGRCASSAVMVLLKHRDPLAQAVLALAHTWMASWHLYARHHGRLTLGWKRVAKRLATTKPRSRWGCAKGPMAALQLCLQDLG